LLVDLVLYNGKVYIPKGLVEAGIAIDEGRIVKIAKETNLPKASVRTDLKGCIALPGLIDPHVHLRDQELAYEEDFFTGTAAAAAGGVTSVLDMPNNTPVTMDSRSLKDRMKLAEKRVVVNVGFYSAFPENTEEITSIVREGAVAFKLYLMQKIGGIDIDNDEALLSAFDKVKKMRVPVAVHAEDKRTIEKMREKMRNKRRGGLEALLKVHSPEAEVKAIRRVVKLAGKSGVHVHFCHLSSADGLNAVLRAKRLGLPFTCEVTPHHLLLTSKHLKRYKTMALTLPPLRAKEDVTALWSALKQGSIDTLASDHAPHSKEEKEAKGIWNVKPGIAGLETMLPLLLTQVNKGRLTLSTLIRLASEKPAEIFHLSDRGSLSEGYAADIVVVDVDKAFKIDASKFHSKAKFSPFNKWSAKGKPMKTFVNGRLVMDEGELVTKPGTGGIIR